MNKFLVKGLLVTTLLSLAGVVAANAQWSEQGNKIKTQWAAQVSPNNISTEYPRPIMQRNRWQSLDGLWNYSIRRRGAANMGNADGKILVPFAVESSLSGVMKTVGKDQELWYSRTFDIPADWQSDHIMLHFGAVDWQADVYINDIRIGSHRGGYAPFSLDITPYIDNAKQQQNITIRVFDPTTDGYQPVGKQKSKPEGIWYTPVTGIWQTVWIEPVAAHHITALNTVSDIDNNRLCITPLTSTHEGIVEVTISDGKKIVATGKAAAGQPVDLTIDNPHLWSPDDPYLYTANISLFKDGKLVDKVESYAAMRKISTRRDANGIMRIQLNNRDIFQMGPLDQGYWPDGLYTAPNDEALRYDIQLAKRLGFNMIRKHMKTEPARWYTWCDRLGVLVWQDMPCGDSWPEWQMYNFYNGAEVKHSAESENNFRNEWKEIIDALQPYPCIVTWTPFNERWGQFKTQEIVEWTKAYDPTRLVNPASGGNHYAVGDMLDIHHYPDPSIMLYDANRPTVLGEYGGLGLPVKGHLWQDDKNWGYAEFKNVKEVTNRYVEYTDKLQQLIKTGFSAAVYTQTTDVEGEVNGLVTYDRKVLKVDAKRVAKANNALCHALDNNN